MLIGDDQYCVVRELHHRCYRYPLSSGEVWLDSVYTADREGLVLLNIELLSRLQAIPHLDARMDDVGK